MKIDPNATLLAAQAMRTQAGSTAAQAARAQFMAELQRSNAQAARTGQGSAGTEFTQSARMQAAQTRTAAQQDGVQTGTQDAASNGAQAPRREAPLRGTRPDRPLPPGSLLNIVV